MMASRARRFRGIVLALSLLACTLFAQAQQPDISGLNSEDRSSIEAACSTAKYLNGPASYHQCLQRQLAELANAKFPDLSGLNSEDRSSIEAACSTAKYLDGPASYHQCLQRQLAELANSKFPDLSGLNSEDRSSIEAACSTAKYLNGPASYHQCLQRQLAEFSGSNFPALSGSTSEETPSESVATKPTPKGPIGSQTGPCAENGSCYGDLNTNGVPKTAHVNGYYRKDGTYVRGYYRNAPGTNSPKH